MIGGPINLAAMFLLAQILWKAVGSVIVLYSTNHAYLHRFLRLRFCVCVLNVFYFQTDFNLHFMQTRRSFDL